MRRFETPEVEQEPPRRFRPADRPLTDRERSKMTELRAQAEVLARLIEACRPVPTHYTALAIVNLEQAVMWATKELTS